MEVPVTADWMLIKIPWSMFAPGRQRHDSSGRDWRQHRRFAFQAGWSTRKPRGSMMYVPTPAMYSFELDDLGFY